MNLLQNKKILGKAVKAIMPNAGTPEEKTSAMLSENRARGNALKETLNAIPFHKNRIQNPADPEFLGTMKTMRDSLVKTLDGTDPLSQDISEIDKQLTYAANAWSSAVTQGYYGKAKWSIAALSRGVKNYRTNVPADKEDQIEAVLKKRLEQAKVYTSLIMNAESIDAAEQAIKNIELQINDHNEKLGPIRKEVEEARTDKEKLKMLARLKAVQLNKIKVTELTEKESDFRDMIDTGVNLSKTVEMLRNNLETAKTRLNTAQNMFAASRAKLSIEELVENKDLLAAYTMALDEMVKMAQSALIDAEKVRQGYLAYKNQMNAVWDTVEGQNAFTETNDFVEEVLSQKDESGETDIAIGMLKAADEKSEKNQQKEEELTKMLEENKNKNQNQNYNYNT